MKKIKLLLFTLLFFVTVQAQTTSKEEQKVQQVIENMFATLSSFDTVALKTLVTNNVRFYEYGEVWTIDSLIKIVMRGKSIPDFKRTNSFQVVKTNIQNETAWVTYYLQSLVTRNGKEDTVNWMETVILIKEKNKWKIELLHSTRLLK